MKKILSVIVVLSMLAGAIMGFSVSASADDIVAWDGTVATVFAGGNGTSSNPYEISNGAELAYLAQVVNAGTGNYRTAYYELTADIVLNNGDATQWADAAPANNFTTIGSWTSAFGGNFDGQGHTISGLYIKTDADGQGLFGCIQGGAVIQNFALVNSYIQSTGGGATGAIIGQSNRGDSADITVKNIFTDAIIVAKGGEVAGVLGNISDSNDTYTAGAVTVSDVVFAGSVSATGNYSAGIIGNARSVSVTVKNCMNIGTITSTGKHVAGIMTASLDDEFTIENCISVGELTGSSNVFALVYCAKDKAAGNEDAVRAVIDCYYVDGIAKNGATKRADASDSITVLESVSALIGANATVTMIGWTNRATDIMVPTAVDALAPQILQLEYTVTWMSEGAVLATETYSAGEMPEYKGATPTKAEDENYIYNFNGWLPELKAVMGDATYEADFYRTRKTSIDDAEEEETTKAPATTQAPATTEAPAEEEGGCGSAISGVIGLVALVGMGVLGLRKKED